MKLLVKCLLGAATLLTLSPSSQALADVEKPNALRFISGQYNIVRAIDPFEPTYISVGSASCQFTPMSFYDDSADSLIAFASLSNGTTPNGFQVIKGVGKGASITVSSGSIPPGPYVPCVPSGYSTCYPGQTVPSSPGIPAQTVTCTLE